MSPSLALFLCLAFIIILFVIDVKSTTNNNLSIWVPFFWALTLSTLPLSAWVLHILNVNVYANNYTLTVMEGNPIDRDFYFILIVSGILILSRRNFHLSEIFKSNKLILMFILYCGLSTLWANHSFVSLKRWSKEIGNITMILIILTNANPTESTITLIRRLSYFHVPLSIVLIKYFPTIGRSFSVSGELMYIGTALQKNSLGAICVVFFIGLYWDLLRRKNMQPHDSRNDVPRIMLIIMLAITLLCLIYAQCATAIFCAFLGCSILYALGLPTVKNNLNNLGMFVFIVIISFFILQYTVDIMGIITGMLGRNLTFTGRTTIWKDLLAIGTNKLIGSGYQSYWSGARVQEIVARYPSGLNEAHNGYLEIYLNLGWIGLLIFIFSIISGYRKICNSFLENFEFNRLRFVFFILALFMNITEAYFKGLSIIWFFFLLSIIDVPNSRQKVDLQTKQTSLPKPPSHKNDYEIEGIKARLSLLPYYLLSKRP